MQINDFYIDSLKSMPYVMHMMDICDLDGVTPPPARRTQDSFQFRIVDTRWHL